MDTMNERNSRDFIVAEEIKKRWKEYIEELCKKDLHNSEDHNGVITHLEPDILQCGQMGLRKHHYKQN